MGRRSAGEGGIYFDETRGLWIYQVTYKDAEGMRQRKKFASKTKRGAMEKGKAFFNISSQGQEAPDNKVTVGQWITTWLANYAKPHIRPRTYEKYASTLNVYILRKYENTLLRDLTAVEMQKHFNGLLERGRSDGKGLSTATVRSTRRYFCACLDEAVREKLIVQNVVRLTKAPKLVKREIVVIDKKEVEALVAKAREIGQPFMRMMVPEVLSLTAHTGLRQGEVFALKWEDVDFDNSCLYIRRSLAHVVGRGPIFQEPKTKNSRRRVLLLPEDVCSLKHYRDWLRIYADELGEAYVNQDLVFPSTIGKPVSTTNFIRRYFKPLLRACHIKEGFTFHGLRHTHATLLLKQGVNPKIVQERLGHSSIKVTMDTYSHVLPDMQQQAIDALQIIFSE